MSSLDAVALPADSWSDSVLCHLESSSCGSQICLPFGLRENRTLSTNCAVSMRDNASQQEIRRAEWFEVRAFAGYLFQLCKQKLLGFLLVWRHILEELEHKVADKVRIVLVSVEHKVSCCNLKSPWRYGIQVVYIEFTSPLSQISNLPSSSESVGSRGMTVSNR